MSYPFDPPLLNSSIRTGSKKKKRQKERNKEEKYLCQDAQQVFDQNQITGLPWSTISEP